MNKNYKEIWNKIYDLIPEEDTNFKNEMNEIKDFIDDEKINGFIIFLIEDTILHFISELNKLEYPYNKIYEIYDKNFPITVNYGELKDSECLY